MDWLSGALGSLEHIPAWFHTQMNLVNDQVIHFSGAWWVLPVVLLFCAIDGFFPPIPSESIVVGLGAIAMSTGKPNVLLLVLAAGVGAWLGDNLAYVIGRLIGIERFRWMRRPRVKRSFDWAGRELRKRAVSLILVARFIPGGRVAVNFTAGATGFSQRRFMTLTVLSGIGWALYSVLVGAFAGAWLKHNPLLGAALAIVVALVLGALADRIVSAVHARRGKDDPAEAPGVHHSEAPGDR